MIGNLSRNGCPKSCIARNDFIYIELIYTSFKSCSSVAFSLIIRSLNMLFIF